MPNDDPGATVQTNTGQDPPEDFQPAAAPPDEGGDDTQGGEEADAPEGAGGAEGEEAAADDTLLTDEQIEALAGDPAKLAKEFQKAYTRKTQKLAQQVQFIRMMDEHPEEMLGVLAGKRGLKLVKSDEGAAGGDRAGKVDDETHSMMEQLFGSDLADKMIPVIEKIAERVANKRVAPIEEQRQADVEEAAKEVTRQTMETMGEKYPDWKKYENEMIALSRKIQPTRDITPLEYSVMLYKAVRQDREVADRTRTVVDRMQRSAAASQPRHAGVGSSRVAQAPEKMAFEEAWEMAKKGIKRARA